MGDTIVVDVSMEDGSVAIWECTIEKITYDSVDNSVAAVADICYEPKLVYGRAIENV